MLPAQPYVELDHLTDLSSGIEAVWTSVSDREMRYRVLPDGRCDLILRFEARDVPGAVPLVVITGPTAQFYDLDLQPGAGFAGLRIRPGYFRAVFGFDPENIREGHLRGQAALEAVPALAALCAPVAAIGDLPGRLSAFVRAAVSGNPDRPSRRVAHLLGAFHASGGQMPVSELARLHRISTRSLHRDMLKATGLAPKLYAEILQFQRAMRLVRDHHMRPADAAFEAGYADQAHMSRMFRQFGGMTPARLSEVTLVTLRP